MLFRLDNIKKSYGGYEILRGVSFQINPNEKIGLVGRNGAGKTTVFRIITGEEASDSGEVIKMNNLKLGLLEQNVQFNDDETVHTSALSAFQKIHDIEAEMRLLEKQMETDSSSEILEKYAELQTEFEQLDGFSYTAKAEAILLGLGFNKETWTLETKNLSGGQKNRLGMVRLLLSSPDVLLLDEPTNHIDVEAVEWLENFLQTYPTAYIIISHDRYFLDKTAKRIVEIDKGKAITYNGNYSAFLVEREFRREQQRREFENQQAYIAKTEEFIRRNLEGQKTKQAKSRRTMLQKMDRVEAVSTDKSSGNFNLKNVERTGTNVLAVEDLSVGYGEKILAKKINFTLHRGECLGVIGGNGTGKTTFLKTILGNHRELAGKIFWGTKVETGYYSQKLEDLDERNEVLNELRRVAPSTATNGELRSFLARFLFMEDDVFKRVSTLSGGEKGRLALAKLIYSQVNVLILDEPTNHLDIPSREALEEALSSYPGTIITVSHDRYFLDQVSTQILEIKEDKSVEIETGNYSEYKNWKANRESRVESREIFEVKKIEAEKPNEQKPKVELSKNQRQRIESRISKIEQEIPANEERLSALTIKMSEPETATNHEELAKFTDEFQNIERKIKTLYEEWENLLENISS